jgi:L-ribulokinase
VSEPTYSIGVDFGTESGRALLLDARTGAELGVSVVAYPSAVIDRELPGTGERLPPDWALQDPDDWVTVIETGLPEVLGRAGVDPRQVVGIGVDFTSCTVLPVTAEGVPLCKLPRFRARRHAWPKLWKHHAAQADRAVARGPGAL